MTKSEYTLQAFGVHKRFGPTLALRDVSLGIKPGEWLGLLGPNGAGKTTLMNILTGLLPPDEGHFTLHGETINPTSNPQVARQIGLVPQDLALYASLTAEENLRVFARFHGVARQRISGRVHWALEWTGLEERAADRVSTFSGGMKRRLNIACAVLHEPPVLLLDEPTVGVDPQARQKIWTMLRGLLEEGTALLHSSHQLDEVEATCDRVVILDRGEKKGEGAVTDLLQRLQPKAHLLTMRFARAPAPDVFGPDFTVEENRVHGFIADPA
ncbi:MAG: ABC transporter ATP-binding protein, partial [Verrucomicrobiota bacterium]